MSLVKCCIYQIFLIPNSGKKDGVRKVAQPLWLTVGLGSIFVGKAMVGFFSPINNGSESNPQSLFSN